MIKAGAIAKGSFLLAKGEPYVVVEREFHNPGKGSAVVRVKMKNLKTGAVISQTIKTQEMVEDVEVEVQNYQYLYADAESYHFMDNQTYDQVTVPIKGFEEKKFYLKEGDTYQLVIWENKPMDVVIPYKLTFVITEAQDAIKGDTVTGATKLATVETGLKVKVPLFIKTGDKILVNTETNEYVERVNK